MKIQPVIISLLILSMLVFVIGASGCAQTCPVTSKDTSTPCCTAQGTGELSPNVAGIIVKQPCKCPSDTTYASEDVITAGGPYNICTCNAC